MYCLTLCFLALFALASGYIPGREYVYRYSGQITSGFPDKKHQFSGVAHDSIVRIQYKADHATVKVENVRYAKFTEELEDFDHYTFDYHPLPDTAKHIYSPYNVYFRNGQVTHFDVAKGEPTFAINLKKAFISLFHLNFDHTESPALSEKDNELYRPNYSAHYYKTYEDGVLGNCETQYVLEHHPYYLTPQNNLVLNVTKSRNYHKCNDTPNHYYSTFYGHECADTEHEEAHTLHGNAFYHYNIRGGRHHYVIEHVTSEGELSYTPYPIEGQFAEVYSNRTLDLLEEKEITEDIEPHTELETHNSLHYEISFKPKFKGPVDLKAPHYLYHIYGFKIPLEKIKQEFDDLIHVYDDDTYHKKAQDVNYPAKFLELVRAFGTLSYDDIETLYHKYADFPRDQNTAEKIRYRNLFYDALVSSGTNPAIHFGKYLIHNRKVSPTVALYFIEQLHDHVKEVTEPLLDDIYELCEESYVKEHHNLYAECYFTLSNIVHDHCIAQYHPEGGLAKDESTCPEEAANKYFHHIAQHYEETDEEFYKVAYLKAIGNIGVRDSLRYIKPYVEGQCTNRYLRTTAIFALKNVGRRYPQLVRELIVPLYYNHSENYEQRIAAFIVLMKLKPELYELETLARDLIDEDDDQLKSYVYSTFKSLANSTHPCDHKMSHDIRYALSLLRHHEEEFENYDYSYSHHHYVSGYDADYDFGGYTRLAYLASDNGYIPRHFYFGVNDFIGGKSFNTFGVGFKQYGLEKFVDKLFGPEGAYGKKSLFDLFKKREKRETSNVEKERKEIKEKLKLPTKEYDPIHGEIFFKYMGNHISFLYFNESTFESFFKEGVFGIPNIPAKYQKVPKFSYQRFLLTVDKLYIIPSESGLPVIFDYKQPAYLYHKNEKLEAHVNPAFFKEDRQNELPTDIEVKIDGHLICDKNLYASVGALLPFDQQTFGSGINRRSTLSLPIKFDIDVNLKESKVDFKWIPVVNHEIYHFKYEPYTFIDSYKNQLPVDQEESYHPVRREGFRKHTERHFFHDALGFGFNVQKDFDNEFNDFGSFYRFFTEKDYREKFYYLYANPQFEPYIYNITIEGAHHDATTEVDIELDYSFFRDDDHESHLAHEDFEEYGKQALGKHFHKSVLHGSIVGKGTKERKVEAEWSYTRSLDRTQNRWNVYYDRTPFTSDESEHFKVCLSGFLKYPDLDLKKISQLDTFDIDRTVESKLKVHFGKDCHSESKITVQGKFEATEEQIRLEHEREIPVGVEHHNPYASVYQECQKEQQSSGKYSKHCIDYMHMFANVHKYTFHVKHEHLTARFKNITYKIGGFFRNKLYPYADHNIFDVHNPDDELHFEANFSAIYPVADIRVKRPRSESNYNHVYWPNYHPFPAHPFHQDLQVKRSFNHHYCLIEGDHVNTFDHFDYELPKIDCYKVIAKDCSPNEHFIVLASKITHPKYHKALKVILGKHKIEALPVSDDSDIVIRVDGQKVAVTDEEPYFHNEDHDDEHQKHTPDFYVVHRDFYYALYSEKYGIIVEYDGDFIVVEVAPFYRAKLCGLCGNYNGQKYDGYEVSKNCFVHDTDSYAYSYVIQTDTCTVPKADVDCYGEGPLGCTELRTHIVQLTTGKVPQTCFSTEAVPQCRSKCVPRETVKRTVGYHCLPAKDDSTKNLLKQQQTRILYEVRRKSRDYEEEVEFPEGCHVQE